MTTVTLATAFNTDIGWAVPVGADPTGAADSTTALQAWAGMLASGYKLFLPAGKYKTSATILFSASSGQGAVIEGAGPQTSVIVPTSNTFHAVRVNIPGQFNSKGSMSNIGVNCASALPSSASSSASQKAAFCFDATTLFSTWCLEATGYDIGLDQINDCYNLSHFNFSVPRFGSCNCGINMRTGGQSGSDIQFYNVNVHAAQIAININGGGGGYHFYGGQIANADQSGATGSDNWGAITIGKDYVCDGTGTVTGLATNLLFSGLSVEGWHGSWAIRGYAEFNATFQAMGFTPSVSTTGQVALGIMKLTGAGNSILNFQGCGVGQGYFYSTSVCSISGDTNSFMCFESGWWSAAGTVLNTGGSSTTTGSSWLASLTMSLSPYTSFTFYKDGGSAYNILSMGNGRIRYNWNNSQLERSNDAGSTWAAV